MAIQKAIQKSGILSPWCNPLDPGDRFYRRVSAITRAIMNFNGTQYATLSEPVVLDGDFEIEWTGSVTGVDADQVIANTELYAKLRVTKSGHVQFLVGDGSGWLSVALLSSTRIDDGKLHTVSITRVDETYYLAVDGQIESTRTVAGCDVQMATLFRRSSSNIEYMKGVPFSLKIWKDGDRNTGELVTDLRFDQSDTNYQRNYAVALGSEMWTSGNYDSVNVPAWSTIVSQTLLSVAGRCYEVSMDVSVDSGAIHIVNFSGYPHISESGRYSYVVHAKNTGQFVIQSMGNGFAGSIRNVSIKERSSAILENTLPGDWEEISKKSGDDFWTGDGGRVIEYAEGAL